MSRVLDKGSPYRTLLKVLFIVYILLVPFWVILMKSSFWFFFNLKEGWPVIADKEMFSNFTKIANLNPFWIFWKDMLMNVAAFIPFGIYLEMHMHRKPFIIKALIIFGSSLIIEITQFVFMLGATDIVDLIANTLGGVLGLVTMKLLFRDKAIRVILILAAVTTVITAITVGINSARNYKDLKELYSWEQDYTYPETADYPEAFEYEEAVPAPEQDY